MSKHSVPGQNTSELKMLTLRLAKEQMKVIDDIISHAHLVGGRGRKTLFNLLLLLESHNVLLSEIKRKKE